MSESLTYPPTKQTIAHREVVIDEAMDAMRALAEQEDSDRVIEDQLIAQAVQAALSAAPDLE